MTGADAESGSPSLAQRSEQFMSNVLVGLEGSGTLTGQERKSVVAGIVRADSLSFYQVSCASEG
jgi:hypothetical protein